MAQAQHTVPSSVPIKVTGCTPQKGGDGIGNKPARVRFDADELLYAIPGLGPLVAAGVLATTLAGAATGAVAAGILDGVTGHS